MNDHIFFLKNQEVIVDDFGASGWILDIGGGGEGVIGQLKEQQVIAIDPNQRELLEAADGPLMIVMDASRLQFLDGTFEVVTSFFTLMYITSSMHEKIFEEVFRVLEPNGRFLVWDIELPSCLNETKELVAFYLHVKLPNREIDTGYGTKWPERVQGLSYYKEIAEHVGFNLSEQKENGRALYLEFRKP